MDSPERRALAEPLGKPPTALNLQSTSSDSTLDDLRVSSVVDVDRLSVEEAGRLTNKLMAVRNGRNPVRAAEKGQVDSVYLLVSNSRIWNSFTALI